ncbi:START domain-containing protein, partial [Haematococcus lacustris]
QNWEAFLIRVQLLEQGDWEGHREQVVRWVRRFPFHFLSDREYLIARKVWATRGGRLVPLGQGAPNSPLYAVTKSLEEHPVAGPATVLVRTSAFDSTWRCRAVPDPWGGPNTAAEVVLLHSEDIKIPEYLAKTAVKLGMAKFVRELA